MVDNGGYPALGTNQELGVAPCMGKDGKKGCGLERSAVIIRFSADSRLHSFRHTYLIPQGPPPPVISFTTSFISPT